MLKPITGRILSAAGAALLILTLFLVWYHVDRDGNVTTTSTGWETFPRLRIIILVGALLTLATAVVAQTRWVLIARTLLGLVLAAQFFVSEEMLAMELFAAAVAVGLGVTLFPEQWRPRLGSCIRPVALGLAICVGLAAVPAGIQFFGPQHVAGTVNPRGFYVSDLLGFVIATPLQWLAPGPALDLSQRFTGNLAEWNAYIGLPLLAIAAYVTVTAWARPLIRFLAMLCGLLMMLSLGPTLHVAGFISPIPSLILGLPLLPFWRRFKLVPLVIILIGSWAVLAVVPLVDDILPGRLMILVFLLLGVLLAVFIDMLPKLPVRRGLAAIGVALAALLVLVPSMNMPATAYADPGFFPGTTVHLIPRDSVVVVAPYAYEWDDLAMLWQSSAGLWFKMPEGYGTVPGPSLNPPRTGLGQVMIALDQGAPYHGMSQHLRARLWTDLRSWRVQAVIVGPMSNQPAMVRFMTDLIGQPPQVSGGVYVWPAIP
jgi:hypothetical protein